MAECKDIKPSVSGGKMLIPTFAECENTTLVPESECLKDTAVYISEC